MPKVRLKEIDCVLFDLDGTLIDTVDLIHRSFDYAVRTILGSRLSREELLKNMGRPLAVQMKFFSKTKTDELIEAYNRHNLAEHDKYISPYSGIAKALSRLHGEGKKMGVVTSKKRDLCLRGLKITGLIEYFPVIVAMEDTNKHKPDPEPVLLALKKFDCPPERAVFIGDSPFDVSAGKSAGAYTAAALWGPFPLRSLRLEQPDFELTRISDLWSALGR